MATKDESFQCVVIAPQGKLVNCQASSVIFPAHDGYVGIWQNHVPMFCGVGLGIMEVRKFIPGQPQGSVIYLLINEGFLLMTHNQLTATATEAISLEGMDSDKVEQTLEKTRKKLATGTFTKHQLWVENRKLTVLTKLAARYKDAGRQNAETK